MLLNKLLIALVAASICTGCPDKQVRLGKNEQFVYLKGPFQPSEQGAEKACDSLGDGWSPAPYHFVAKEIENLPDSELVYSFEADLDTNAVYPKIYIPKFKSYRPIIAGDKMAVICDFSQMIADQKREQRAELAEREAKRPKGDWQSFKHSKTEDKFAIIGHGTQQEALSKCGHDYLPKYSRDVQRLNDELHMRYQGELQKLSTMKDSYERKRLNGELNKTDLAAAVHRGTGLWFYMEKNRKGSTNPWIVAGRDDGDLSKVAVIVCLDAEEKLSH